jgi:hypothetical protein
MNMPTFMGRLSGVNRFIAAALSHGQKRRAREMPTMPDPTTPSFGYQPRKLRLMDTQLKLDPTLLWSLQGWSMQTTGGQLLNLDLPSDWDDPLCRACGDFASAMRLNPNQDPLPLARNSLLGLSPDTWDKLYGVARKLGPLAWPKLYGPGINIETGQHETIGSRDPAGEPIFDSGTDVIAGFGLNTRWLPFGAFSLGKRFAFASDPDVSFILFADKDAFLLGAQPLSGAGLDFEAKTSLGPIKFKIGVGRAQTGNAAFGFTLQLGPDYLPQGAQAGPSR